jgi:hypothetical protein
MIKDVGKPTEECFAIFVVPEDHSSFNAPGHYVLQKTGCV